MKMTDETLSAFLDNELTDAEMEAVRDQIEKDPTLADRLAEMASVDAELQAHYGSIDDRPMPASITRMLEEKASRSAAPAQDNVAKFTRLMTRQA
jgi:anti-sigma factor RsiW